MGSRHLGRRRRGWRGVLSAEAAGLTVFFLLFAASTRARSSFPTTRQAASIPIERATLYACAPPSSWATRHVALRPLVVISTFRVRPCRAALVVLHRQLIGVRAVGERETVLVLCRPTSLCRRSAFAAKARDEAGPSCPRCRATTHRFRLRLGLELDLVTERSRVARTPLIGFRVGEESAEAIGQPRVVWRHAQIIVGQRVTHFEPAREAIECRPKASHRCSRSAPRPGNRASTHHQVAW